MEDNGQQKIFEIHLEEYKTVKAEQLRRIAVRDNVVYLTIAVFGLVIGVTVRSTSGLPLLVIPWTGILLGWTYLMNDQKVSEIGRYIRFKLDDRMKKLAVASEDLFGWETEHRSDERRIMRKRVQLGIDLLTFVVPGLIALAAFVSVYPTTLSTIILAIIESLALVFLAWQIWIYADLASGK